MQVAPPTRKRRGRPPKFTGVWGKNSPYSRLTNETKTTESVPGNHAVASTPDIQTQVTSNVYNAAKDGQMSVLIDINSFRAFYSSSTSINRKLRTAKTGSDVFLEPEQTLPVSADLLTNYTSQNEHPDRIPSHLTTNPIVGKVDKTKSCATKGSNTQHQSACYICVNDANSGTGTTHCCQDYVDLTIWDMNEQSEVLDLSINKQIEENCSNISDFNSDPKTESKQCYQAENLRNSKRTFPDFIKNQEESVKSEVISSIKSWSVQDVARFLAEIPECCCYIQVFVDESIDGVTLTQLSDEHLLNYMGMKLGHAIHLRLAINQHLKLESE